TQNDPKNCNGCGRMCSGLNISIPSCSGGMCNGTCNAGSGDCNNDKYTDGCETNIYTSADNCGGCFTQSATYKCSTQNILRDCTSGACEGGGCSGGYSDCNNDKRTDGCEVNTNADALHCGGCTGKACSTNNIATPTCTNGVCDGTCNAGFADCNNMKLM